MSGILAILQRDGAPVPVPVVAAMLDACPERAVHGQRVWQDGPVALAHQHFWVLPEESGERQPLTGRADGCILAFDGRLDNRAALQAALRGEARGGRAFSDAELVSLAYERWKTDCAAHLLGDFCFAVWDPGSAQLYVARDALGARSAAYWLDDDRLVMASEIIQVLAHPAVPARLNEGKVAEFLAGVWDNHEETFYQGILYCPPGHCLLVSASSVEMWRYWDVEPGAKIRYRSDGEYAEHYLELLLEAVRCRLRSGGPVAISLSGGLDSTSLAALAADHLPESAIWQTPLRSYSYIFRELLTCDERRYIAPVVDRYQIEATYLPCDDRWTLRDPTTWPGDRGFVLSDPYARLPEAVMSAAEDDRCRCLLAGYFGDALFTGGQFWAMEMMREARFGMLARTVVSRRHHLDVWQDLVNSGLRQFLPQSMRSAYRRLRPRPVESIHPGLHSSFVRRTGLEDRIAANGRARAFPAPALWSRYRSLTLGILSQGAAATTRFYNAHGLELVTPYWDRRLVEFVLALPADQLGRPGRDRWLHRNAMAGRLPEAVRERSDRTVFLPLLHRGLAVKETSVVDNLLARPRIVQQNIVQARWLEAEVQQAFKQEGDWDLLWPCLSLELWLQRFW